MKVIIIPILGILWSILLTFIYTLFYSIAFLLIPIYVIWNFKFPSIIELMEHDVHELEDVSYFRYDTERYYSKTFTTTFHWIWGFKPKSKY